MKKALVQQPRIRVAAIIVQDGRILLVKHAKAGREYWMLPGGGVGPGEPLSEALERELQEEVCITTRPEHLVLVNDSIPPDTHRHIVNLYFTARIIAGIPAPGTDTRVTAVALVPIGDLSRILLYPDFGRELQSAIRAGFPNRAQYLGNLWKD